MNAVVFNETAFERKKKGQISLDSQGLNLIFPNFRKRGIICILEGSLNIPMFTFLNPSEFSLFVTDVLDVLLY